MNKKITFIVVIIIVAIGLLIGMMLSNQKESMKRQEPPKKKHNYKMETIVNKDVTSDIVLGGHLYAYDKVSVFAEVSGVLLRSKKRFKEGAVFSKGEILLKIDDTVYKNNLMAKKSELLNAITLMLPDFSIDFPERATIWEEYLSKFSLNKSLSPLPEFESKKERYYIASRNIYNLFYNIKSMEATLAKYTVEAPFDGVVTESMINPGTLVRAGQNLGTFNSTEIHELEAFATHEQVNHLKVGQKVVLITDELKGEFSGRIQRINKIIDKKSQTQKVYITTREPRLKEGMYLTAKIKGSPIKNAFRVPRTAMVGNNQLWIVKDSVLNLKKVHIAASEEDHLIINGLKDGTKILTVPPVDAQKGMKLIQSDDKETKNPVSAENRLENSGSNKQ